MSTLIQWLLIGFLIALFVYAYWSAKKNGEINMAILVGSYFGAVAIGGLLASVLLLSGVLPQRFFLLAIILIVVLHHIFLRKILPSQAETNLNTYDSSKK